MCLNRSVQFTPYNSHNGNMIRTKRRQSRSKSCDRYIIDTSKDEEDYAQVNRISGRGEGRGSGSRVMSGRGVGSDRGGQWGRSQVRLGQRGESGQVGEESRVREGSRVRSERGVGSGQKRVSG